MTQVTVDENKAAERCCVSDFNPHLLLGNLGGFTTHAHGRGAPYLAALGIVGKTKVGAGDAPGVVPGAAGEG